ncbi:hypothetical protein DL96DRAFT_152183 [Flagelloscypha sp. PMI_526]|nr:hypothetical protein DL96DRAFT_152183 [Flagelloscypha sp. PMI_526]
MSSNSMWTLTLILLVALFGFVPSINALSVDWKADKHPTHTLDHITAVLSGGSGDPSKVNVVLYTYNQYTGQSYNIPIASNVGNTGSYTVQVPNHYIGDIPSGKTESQYLWGPPSLNFLLLCSSHPSQCSRPSLSYSGIKSFEQSASWSIG